MKGYQPGTASRRDEVAYYVEIWQQPTWRWLVAQAYHLWEKCSWLLFRLIEKYHEDLFKKKGDEFFIPLTNRQDIRCDNLSHRKRHNLAVIYVTPEQYGLITGKTPFEVEPLRKVKEPITLELAEE